MNKKSANELMATIEQLLMQRGSGWERLASTSEQRTNVEGLSEFRYFGKRVLDRTVLLIGLNVDLGKEFVSVAVGWSDTIPLRDVPNNVLLQRKGHIEWHRRGMPTNEFSWPAFERSLGGLVKLGVAKRYEVKSSHLLLAEEILLDLTQVGVEYWQIMLNRRFHVTAVDVTI